MTTIRAVIHDRRIDVPAPNGFPDGTEVVLTIGRSNPDEDGPMPPEEIARVLAAMQKIEPFDWSDEERAAADLRLQMIWSHDVNWQRRPGVSG